MYVLEKTEYIIEELNELLDYVNNLSKELSQVDSAICDLRHWMEHNPIKSKGAYRIVQEFRKLTLERRRIMNDMELGRTLTTNLTKIVNSRDFLLHEMRKTNARLNQPYRNRIYNEVEMEYFLGRRDDIDEVETEVEREENNVEN